MKIPPIKVFLVEDSPVVLRILERILGESSDLEIVGTAANGKEALAKIPTVQPQVICTDLWMDSINGEGLIEWTMAHCPCPILVISEDGNDPETAERLKTLGAIEVMGKPKAPILQTDSWDVSKLIQTIKIVSGVTVFTKPARQQKTQPQLQVPEPTRGLPRKAKSISTSAAPLIDIVAFGVSTGGPRTIQTLLKQIPRDFPVPILCTQHISRGFLDNHIQWLNNVSPLEVSIAKEGEKPKAGHVYYAPESFHLGLTAKGKFWYNPAPPLEHHRPSVTVMFEAIAQVYGARSLAIQLTGMGRDGAQGLLSIAQAGGITAAQNEQSSVVFGMPKEAIALGAAQHVLDLADIPQFLWEWVIAPHLKQKHAT